MKSLYIITLLTLSVATYAQSKTSEQEDQTLPLKQAKEAEAKMPQNIFQQAPSTGLVSDHGLEVKKSTAKPMIAPGNNSGKLLPNTATLEEIKQSIPNRQVSPKTGSSFNPDNTVGLSNNATIGEIKKTIPKNQ